MHPINLALLQQFFNSTELENIRDNSMYHILPDMNMPHFKIYNHTMSKILADDRTKHLSLKKMAENAKKDAVVFQSLTESLLDGEISIEQDWFSTSNIMIYVTMTITAVRLVALVVMYLKLRKALVMLSVLQASVGKTNANAVPRFHYKSLVTPEPLRTNPFIDSQLTWDHTIFFISCCTLIILIFWTVCLCVKKRNRVILMLEVTSGENCVFISLRNLPLCPSFWTVHPPQTVESIQVKGKFWPVVHFKWEKFKIVNKTNEQTCIISQNMKINFFSARKIKTITNKPYDAYFYWSHGGWLEPITKTD